MIEKNAWDVKPFQTISEEDLRKIPQKSLLDLLKEKIPQLNIGNYYADGCFGTEPREVGGKKLPPASRPYAHDFTNFLIGQQLIAMVMIDNVNTIIVDPPEGTMPVETYNIDVNNVSVTAVSAKMFHVNMQIFNALSAADIKNITVYKGCASYVLDITTRSGRGPWVIPTLGKYVYRPQPIYHAKEFYSPRYNVNNNPSTPDLRSTIFWEANVVTNEEGKAVVSFFTSDQPGTYSYRIEGTDLQGRFGFRQKQLKVQTTSK